MREHAEKERRRCAAVPSAASCSRRRRRCRSDFDALPTGLPPRGAHTSPGDSVTTYLIVTFLATADPTTDGPAVNARNSRDSRLFPVLILHYFALLWRPWQALDFPEEVLVK